jgi:general stress protein CsbA
MLLYKMSMTSALQRHILVLLAYALVVVAMSFPLIGLFTTHFVGIGGDPWQTLWRFEDKANALTEAAERGDIWPLVQNEFFGGGQPRLTNISVWPWLWLYFLVGQPVTYSIVWLVSYIAAGYGMYLLTRWLFRTYGDGTHHPNALMDELPAFIAGLIYMFLPFHVAHSFGHFGAMQIQWFPFILLALFSFVQRPRMSAGVLGVILVTIQAWSEHHYLLWLAVLILLYGLFHQRIIRGYLQAPATIAMVSFLTIAGLLLAFLPYWPTAQLAGGSGNALALGIQQTIRFSADPFAFVVPAPFHPLWGGLAYKLFSQNFTGNLVEATHFLGLVPLLLVLFFHQEIPRTQKRWWILVASVFLIISLGPRLHLLGRVTAIPLPYAIIDSWPIFNVVRSVGRAAVFVGLAWSVLAGWVLHTQLRRPISAAFITLALLLEFLFLPVPLQSFTLSPAYDAIRDLPGGTVIEIPAATNYAVASKALYASHRHGKSVLASIALERAFDPNELKEIKAIPGIKQLLFVRSTDLAEKRPEFFGQNIAETAPEAFHHLGIGAVILHHDSVSARQLELLQAFLEQDLQLTAQEFEDAVIYPTSHWLATPPTKSDGVFLVRGAGWDSVTYDKEKQQALAAFDDKATITVINTHTEPLLVEFSFSFAEKSAGSVVLVHDGRASEPIAAQGEARRSVTVEVGPGEHEVQWENRVPGTVILFNPAVRVRRP